MTENITNNAFGLQQDLLWLNNVIQLRMNLYFNQETNYNDIYEINPPNHKGHSSVYSNFVNKFKLTFEERVILLMSLCPHICPQILDIFFTQNETYRRPFTEFGGLKGVNHSGFLPTGETVAFVLAPNNLKKRFEISKIFDPDHFFAKMNIIRLEKDKSNEPLLSGALNISKEYLSYFTFGEEYKPTFNMDFPAQRLTTQLEWSDLVLEPFVMEEVEEIVHWVKYQKTIMDDWGLRKKLKPGFRSLFYGPPGTGKTLTASLIGKITNKDVYRVDLSKIVSKYIGETEKNLANIFDQASNKNWILFFDEADALFGKRTVTKDSKDRHANQEIAYLLQRIEDFEGLIVLATNLKSNIDEAFGRRFQSMIYFPMPKVDQRLLLWKNAFHSFKLDEGVDLYEVAKEIEVAGGAIINVLRYCALKAATRDTPIVFGEDIYQGIKKEFRKTGKTI
ncbi:MAG: ATP-binding protein [Bacteroidota bacterium]